MWFSKTDRINQTRNALVAQIDETKAFLEMEKHRPEDIRAKIDQIMAITIPFNEEQIRQLSENVRGLIFNFRLNNYLFIFLLDSPKSVGGKRYGQNIGGNAGQQNKGTEFAAKC
jgi:hypothetical protein